MRDARTREYLLAMPGVATTRRPGAGGSKPFDLAYVRTGPRERTPVVALPGGPGLASVAPYAGFRERARHEGLDVLMMEHRGVGLSRTDTHGADLPFDAVSVRSAVDDLAAVLDDADVDRAVVYGSSYGSYLAHAFGAAHPERVAGMVLDSPVLGARDNASVRRHSRSLLWDGEHEPTSDLARGLNLLVRTGRTSLDEVGEVARVAYEFGGPRLLRRLAAQFLAGRADRTWRWIASLGDREVEEPVPHVMEFDIAGAIAFRELGFAADPDGGPFDPAARFAGSAHRFPAFTGDDHDVLGALASFDWPLVVLRGEQDLRTSPETAELVASTAPRGALVTVTDTGHSLLDTHPVAALATARALQEGAPVDGAELAALPRRGASRHVSTLIRARLAAERAWPRPVVDPRQ